MHRTYIESFNAETEAFDGDAQKMETEVDLLRRKMQNKDRGATDTKGTTRRKWVEKALRIKATKMKGATRRKWVEQPLENRG